MTNFWVRGRNPAPEPGETPVTVNAHTVGSKYAANKDLSTTEIAKLVRADIKAAVKSGKLPRAAKVSVKTDYYSMGSAIRVRVSGITPAFNPAWLVWTKKNPHLSFHSTPEAARERYSPLVVTTMATVEKIVASYNYDNSDSMTDYHDSNFHADVSFSSYGPGDEGYEAELTEALYIDREVTAGNPEVVKLATEHVARYDEATIYEAAVKAAAKNGIVPILAPRHLTLVKPEPVEPAHVAFLKYLGAE